MRRPVGPHKGAFALRFRSAPTKVENRNHAITNKLLRDLAGAITHCDAFIRGCRWGDFMHRHHYPRLLGKQTRMTEVGTLNLGSRLSASSILSESSLQISGFGSPVIIDNGREYSECFGTTPCPDNGAVTFTLLLLHPCVPDARVRMNRRGLKGYGNCLRSLRIGCDCSFLSIKGKIPHCDPISHRIRFREYMQLYLLRIYG